MAIYYVDLENGNDANSGLSFALRKKTVTSIVASWAVGDVIRIMGSPVPTSLGVNGTWTKDSGTVTLASAVTKNVDLCDSGWVAAANITATHSSANYRQGTAALLLTPATAFTTGLMAYKALGAANDFSAYQQISFWAFSSTSRAAGFFTMTLCSDAAGVTAVNTLSFPALGSGVWTKIVIDNAAALGASIQSVAINATSDPGTNTLRIDNIFASKAKGSADELTLLSLISPNTNSPTTDPWLSIGTVNGTTITLNGNPDATSTTPVAAPYRFATETTTAYVRQPIVLSATIDIGNSPTGSGDYGYVTGGWNRTDMSTRTDITCVTRAPGAANQNAIVLGIGSRFSLSNFLTSDINQIGIYLNTNSTIMQINDCFATGCQWGMYMIGADVTTVTNFNSHFCKYAIDFSGSGTTVPWPMNINFGEIWGTGAANGSFGVYMTYNNTNKYYAEFELSGKCIYNTQYAIGSDTSGGHFDVYIKDIDFRSNGVDLEYFGEARLWKTTHDDLSLPLTTSLGSVLGVVYGSGLTDSSTSTAYPSLFYDNRLAGPVLRQSTLQRRSASDYSWEHTVTSATVDYDQSPIPLCQIPCAANESKLVKVWAYRADSGSIGRIRVLGGWYDGIANDITDELSTTAAWEELSISFTPTEDCVVVVYMESIWVSGGTKTVYFDDLTIT